MYTRRKRIRKRKRDAPIMAHSNIPHEFHMDILSKLGVKSLMRFKCVSKTWSVLINDPGFRNLHSQNCREKKDECLLLDRFRGVYRRTYLAGLANRYPRSHPLDAFRGSVSVYGSYKGLVCLGLHTLNYYINYKSEIALWNPSTREFRILPKSPDQVSGAEIRHPHRRSSWIAFGFDHKANDYKVVKFPRSPNCLPIEVYSLSNNSWHQVEVKMPGVNLRTSSLPTYLNGVYYWVAEDGKVIVAFDMQEKAFDVKPMPLVNRNPEPFELLHVWEVAVLNDSLVLVSKSYNARYGSSFHIWLFDINNGIKSKYATVKSLPGEDHFEEFLGFWNNGDVVIGDVQNKILLYNVTSRKITRKFRFQPPVCSSLAVVNYAESLVQVLPCI